MPRFCLKLVAFILAVSVLPIVAVQVFDIGGRLLSGIVVAVVILAFVFSRTVTRPLRKLLAATIRLAQGDFDVRVDIESRDEFGQLARVFNQVGPRLKEHYRISRSLLIASEVQQALLPHADPDVDGLEIAGRSVYCDETGGDYYDFILPEPGRPGRVAVAVGDVSGHGIQAALLMASARAFIRQRLSMPGGPGEVICDVNNQLARDSEETGQFMTLVLADIDARTGTMTWVNAGHMPILIYKPENGEFEELASHAAALGVADDFCYRDSAASLKPGWIVVLGTDGLWETRNPEGTMFGQDRLKSAVAETAGLPSREIIQAVFERIHAWRGTGRQEDDLTLVAIKVGR